MENKIKYFSSAKDDNTAETFNLAKKRLDHSGIHQIVLASTTGATARKAMNFFKDTGIQLIVIPHQFDFSAVDIPE